MSADIRFANTATARHKLTSYWATELASCGQCVCVVWWLKGHLRCDSSVVSLFVRFLCFVLSLSFFFVSYSLLSFLLSSVLQFFSFVLFYSLINSSHTFCPLISSLQLFLSLDILPLPTRFSSFCYPFFFIPLLSFTNTFSIFLLCSFYSLIFLSHF